MKRSRPRPTPRPEPRNDVLLLLLALAAASGCGAKSVPVLPDKVVGHCVYVNNFSNREECREYVGEWTDEAATADCKGTGSTAVLGSRCNLPESLGACILGGENQQWKRIHFPGGDAALCASSALEAAKAMDRNSRGMDTRSVVGPVNCYSKRSTIKSP